MRKLAVLVLMFAVGFTCQGQKGQFENDMRALTAAGKLENKIYFNKHAGFEVRLPQTPCDAKLNTTMNADNGSAMLLVCNQVVQGRAACNIFRLNRNLGAFPDITERRAICAQHTSFWRTRSQDQDGRGRNKTQDERHGFFADNPQQPCSRRHLFSRTELHTSKRLHTMFQS